MRAQVLGHSSLYRILPTLTAFILIPCTFTHHKIKLNLIKWKVKKETEVKASLFSNVLQQWPYAKKSNPWDAVLCVGTTLLSARGGQSRTTLFLTARDTQGFSPAHRGTQERQRERLPRHGREKWHWSIRTSGGFFSSSSNLPWAPLRAAFWPLNFQKFSSEEPSPGFFMVDREDEEAQG